MKGCCYMTKIKWDGPGREALESVCYEEAERRLAAYGESNEAPTDVERRQFNEATGLPDGFGGVVGHEFSWGNEVGLVFTNVGVFAVRLTAESCRDEETEVTLTVVTPTGAVAQTGCWLTGRRPQFSLSI